MEKKPQKWFQKALKSLDKDLRVRWSFEHKKFIIERKCPKEGLYLPVKYVEENGKLVEKIMPEKSDRYIQYHDGYAGIMYVDKLNESVLNKLKAIDMWENGGNLNKLVEIEEKKREEKKEAEISDEIRTMSREIWDYWNVRGVFNKGGII